MVDCRRSPFALQKVFEMVINLAFFKSLLKMSNEKCGKIVIQSSKYLDPYGARRSVYVCIREYFNCQTHLMNEGQE